MAQPQTQGGSETSQLWVELARLEELAATLAGVADGVTVQDPAGRLLYANPTAAKLIGFDDVDELLRTPTDEIMTRFDVLDELGAPLPFSELPGRMAIAERRPASKVVRFRVRATREEFASEIKATPVLDERGEVRFAVNLFRDVTQELRSNREAQFVADATTLLAASLDPESTLQSLARLAVPELADVCLVDILEPTGSIRRVAEAAIDADKEQLVRQLRSFPLESRTKSPLHEVIRTHRSVLRPETSGERDRSGEANREYLELVERIGLRSTMSVPLVARGRLVAIISFGLSGFGPHYDARHLALAEELARRAALVIENARLFEAERQARAAAEQAGQRIALLAEASRAFAEASLDYGRLLELVARRTAELAADRCTIRLLSDDGAWLETVALHDVDPNELVCLRSLLGERIPADAEGLSGSSIGSSVLAAPLKARARMLGVLSMSRRDPTRPFSHDDLLLAEELAARAALAIDTARAYEGERRARAAAESATQAREELIAVVSHELRSPLTTINISAAVVQEQMAPLDASSGLFAPLHAIQRSVMSMQRLIQDLLDLARLEGGKLELDLRDYDVRSLLEQSIEMHQPLAAESGQRFVLSCEPGCGRVRCDRDRASQVLANLLGNAIKFSPAGGAIDIRARLREKLVEISVSDEGPGVPDEQKQRIFERYVQGHRADGRGVGLGLSIAKGIVEAHGGEIGVDVAPAKGARFWFTLPGTP